MYNRIMRVGIIGHGDVGQAIHKLTAPKHSVYWRDLDSDTLTGQTIDLLHICIPWTEKFETIIAKAIRELSPQLVIISSTVRPGTTQSLFKKTKALLVHAPVTGVHPHLYRHLKHFKKPLGSVNQKAYELAKNHFKELGVKTVRFDTPFETELAKILCTTYYAWNIIFEKWVHDLAQSKKANFGQVYTQWNKIYNTGYKSIIPGVVRPILKHVPSGIGGHCLIPNAEILNQWLGDEITSLILKRNRAASR